MFIAMLDRLPLVLLLVAGVVAVRHDRAELARARRDDATPATPTPAPVSASPSARNVVLTKARNGHFEVEARVDGRRIEFLVDTGASHIALRESEAARLGIYPRPSDYTVRVSTANGITKAALVQLRIGRGRRHRGARRAGDRAFRRRARASTCSACRSCRACAGRTSAASS